MLRIFTVCCCESRNKAIIEDRMSLNLRLRDGKSAPRYSEDIREAYGKKIPLAEQGVNQIFYCLTTGGAWIFGAFVGPPSSGFLHVFGRRLYASSVAGISSAS